MTAPLLQRVRGTLPVFSWGLFDFSNTIFTVNVLNLYFYLWVIDDNSAPDIVFTLAFSSAMLAVALVSPMLGAVSDRYGRRIPFLIVFTLVCVASTAAIGRVGGLPVALLLFAIAIFTYQSGNVYYDSLLATVSHTGNRGRVSALGSALGNVGNIAGAVMVADFVAGGGRGAAFLPTAVLFLFFALPCFLFVREVPNRVPWSFRLVKEGYGQLFSTLRNARRHRDVLRFIGARFLYGNSTNTLFVVMAVYVTKVIGFSDQQVNLPDSLAGMVESLNIHSEVQLLIIIATVFGVLSAFIWGWLADRIGARKTLIMALILWALVFVGVAATFHQAYFWPLGALAGVALAGTGTTERAFLLRLIPPERAGEFFGLYAMVGRSAAVVGPLVWGGTLLLLEDLGLVSYRIAILALLVSVVLGFLVLLSVRERQPEAVAAE